MTKGEFIRLAHEAGWKYADGDDGYDPLWKFGELVAAAEREACARVAEERLLDKANCTAEEMYEMQKKSIAEAIRTRGQHV